MLFRGRRKSEITAIRMAINNAKTKGKKASAQVLQNNSPPGADKRLPCGQREMLAREER
jgi:hypothetical protein